MRKGPLEWGSAARPSAAVALVLSVLAVALSVGLALAGAAASPIEEPLWTRCDGADPEVQCSIPRGVAASPANGHVYVADQNHFRVVELNAVGRFIRAWGSGGSGRGQFGEFGPQGMALDSGGNVYVVDFSNHRVQKFDPEGNFLLMFGGDVNKTKVEASGSSEAERNLCPYDSGDVCQAGTAGTGQGQFGAWSSIGDFITVAPGDKVYVGDVGRIERFDTGGRYQGEIALPGKTVKGLAGDSAGDLYAIFNGEAAVRKISAAGEVLEAPRFAIKAPGGQQLAASAVAVGAAGEVFAAGPTSAEGVQNKVQALWEFSSAGEAIANFGGEGELANSTGLATNICPGSEAPGNLYATNPSSSKGFVRAFGTEPVGCVKAITGPAEEIAETAATLTGTVDPDESPVGACAFDRGPDNGYGEETACAEYEAGGEWHPLASPADLGEGSGPVPVRSRVEGLAAGTVYHYRLRATVGGEVEPGFDKEFKTLGPPVISRELTVSVTDTEAILGAGVNPEGLSTGYRFEYGPDSSYGKATPTQSAGSDREAHAAEAALSGLDPGATYHWRIVASNVSGTTAGADHVFTAYRPLAAETDCANQSLRTGLSALLPDCRAYEMVSPVDKNGGDIVSGASSGAGSDGYVQATPDGDRIAYTSLASFGDEPAALQYNEYLASREAGAGWSTGGIQPPLTGPLVPGIAQTLVLTSRDFIAFSPDLCSAWLLDYQDPPLSAEGQQGYPNLYRRRNCAPGAGGLEALAPAPPALPGGTSAQYVDNTAVQGVSADGRHALFVAKAPLSADASSSDTPQVYERSGGANHLVSVLPSGEADTAGDEVGSGWHHNLDGAVSGDGSRAYWTSNYDSEGYGTIYLREHPEQGIVASECEGENACTVHVGGSSSFGAFFWSATPDGSRALYSEEIFGEAEPNLYEFRLGEPRRLVAHDVMGVAGQSRDLGRIYFVSEGSLAAGAQAEAPNLYLDEEGTIRFVATLAEGDAGAKEPGTEVIAYAAADPRPYYRATRVSAGGRRIAFQSRAPLTGFDNADAASGRPDVEVFSYDAGTGQLHCVSCNPSGAAPRGREMLLPYKRPWEANVNKTLVSAAAWIPTWEHPLHAANALSADGGRIFFNSNDRLLPRDANSTQDVYEWEEAGVGRCEASSADYFPANGGCLYLISSGEGSFEAEFWEASEDGGDAFFTTDTSLVRKDPGLVDLYDARVGGGLAESSPPASCEGEACQSPPAGPDYPNPASSIYTGPANPPAPRECAPAHRHRVRHRHRARGLAHRASQGAKACRRANRRRAHR